MVRFSTIDLTIFALLIYIIHTYKYLKLFIDLYDNTSTRNKKNPETMPRISLNSNKKL